MPKRVLDFDALWSSDKLAACASWAQAEYAWLYGLADCNGSFELTNLRVIWGRVAAIRANLTIERLKEIFDEFIARGLLFTWEANGKRYGHWTGSDQPGRLPPPSWRARLERLAPAVPRGELVAFMAGFAQSKIAPRERSATLAPVDGSRSLCDAMRDVDFDANFGVGPRHRSGASSPTLSTGLSTSRQGLDAAQAQDLDLNLNLDRNQIAGRESEWKTSAPNEPTCATAWAGSGRNNFLTNLSKQKPADENRFSLSASGCASNRPDASHAGHTSAASAPSQRVAAQSSASIPSTQIPVTPEASAGSHVEAGARAAGFAYSKSAASPARGPAPRHYAANRYAAANRVLQEIRAGTGPVLGSGRVRPEALARIRERELRAHELQRGGSQARETATDPKTVQASGHKDFDDAELQDWTRSEEGPCTD